MTTPSSLRPIGSHVFFPSDADPILETDEATYLKSGYLIFDEADKYPEAFQRFPRNDGFGENWVDDKYLIIDSPVYNFGYAVTGDTDGTKWIITDRESSLYSTTDGLNWSMVLTETSNAKFDDVSYMGEMWVATLRNNVSNTRPFFYRSFDGVTWSKVFVGTVGSGTLEFSIAYGNGMHIAMSRRSVGAFYKSTNNFDSYTEVSVPNTRNIVFAKDRFFAHFLSTLYSSPDGDTWTSIALPVNIEDGNAAVVVGERVVFSASSRKDILISNVNRTAFTAFTLPEGFAYAGNNLIATNDSYLDIPVQNASYKRTMLRINPNTSTPVISERVGGASALSNENNNIVRIKTLSTGKSAIWYRDTMLPVIVGTLSNNVNANLTLTFPYPEFPMEFSSGFKDILKFGDGSFGPEGIRRGTSYVLGSSSAVMGYRSSYGGAYIADFAYAIPVVGGLPIPRLGRGYLAQGNTTTEYMYIVSEVNAAGTSYTVQSYRTTDGGATWAARSTSIIGPNASISGICYFNGTWVIAAYTLSNGVNTARIQTSPNSTSWYSRLSLSAYRTRGIAANGNVVVVSIYSSTSNPPGRLYISVDGTNFTIPTYPFGSDAPNRLTTIGDKIVAFVGDSVYSTLDGTNWILEGNMGHPWAGEVSDFLVDTDSGTVLVVRYSGRGMVLSSNNLKDWKVVRNPSDTGMFRGIGRTYDGDVFITDRNAYHASLTGPSIGIKNKHDEGSATKYLRIK